MIRYSVRLPFLRDSSICSTSYTLPVPIWSSSGGDSFGGGTGGSRASNWKSLSVTEPFFTMYSYLRRAEVVLVGMSELSRARSSPPASVSCSGERNSSNTSSGMFILITIVLRRRNAVGGLTSFLSALWSGSKNHLRGHDTVGTGAAGFAGVGFATLADRPEVVVIESARRGTGKTPLRNAAWKEWGSGVLDSVTHGSC